MKTSTLACVASVSVPLILSGTASGGFVQAFVYLNPGAGQYGLTTYDIYAVFDQPGEDQMLSVFGTPAHPLIVEITGGTFFQHFLGTNKAPPEVFVNIFPSLAYDSFVTIGVRTTGNDPQGGGINVPDQLTLTPMFPDDISGSQLVLTDGGWSVPQGSPQGDPFNPDYATSNGAVLIGRFSGEDIHHPISVCMRIEYLSGGVVHQADIGLVGELRVPCFPAPGALIVLGVAGLLGAGRRRRRGSGSQRVPIPRRTARPGRLRPVRGNIGRTLMPNPR